MAFKTCPNCGNKVPTTNVVCPYCGYRFKQNANGGMLLALALVLAIVFAPVIIVLGLFGKFLLKGLYKNILGLEEFKKFRKTYTIICLSWFFLSIAFIVVCVVLQLAIAEYAFYVLCGGNIALFALSIVFGNKIYKKHKDDIPTDSNTAKEVDSEAELIETEDTTTESATEESSNSNAGMFGSNEYDNKKKKFELLAELAALRDANVLTEEEFNEQKQQILRAHCESVPQTVILGRANGKRPASKVEENTVSDEKPNTSKEQKQAPSKKAKRACVIVCATVLLVGTIVGILIVALQHRHNFEDEIIVPPTCEEEGYTKHVCDCGEWYSDTIVSATGHSIENGICTNCDYSELQYTLSASGDSYIFAHGAGGNVVILSEYNGLPVTGIADYAFNRCTGLTSVTIPESVTSIGDSAFYGCSGLTSITIPESVASIGDHAFANLYALEEIYFNATAMEDVDYSDNIFSNVGKDTNGVKVTIGVSVTKIPANLFTWYEYCGGYPLNIKSIEFVEGCVCTDIGYGTFADCDSITSITIPNCITSIGDRAFYGCDILTDVVISDSVTEVGYDAFYGCNSLTSVTCPAVAAPYISNRLLQTIVITSGDAIDDYSFSNCNSLISVKLPDTVTSIGKFAFYNCDSLTSIALPNSITSIGTSAFYDCDSLTSISVDKNNASYKDIDGNLYSKGGKTLIQYAIGKTQTEFIIPNSVTSIGDDAFYGCSSLTSVTIPDSVTSIGDNAFSHCYRLVEVYNKSNLNIIECSYALNIYTNVNGSKLTTDNNGFIIYTDGSDKILVGYTGDETDLILPNGITAINDYAFYSCTSLTSIVIPDSVTSIGYEAFISCTSLTSIIIPDDVKYIDSYAFLYCTSLTIYCEASSEPSVWAAFWNYSYCPVVWGYTEK